MHEISNIKWTGPLLALCAVLAAGGCDRKPSAQHHENPTEPPEHLTDVTGGTSAQLLKAQGHAHKEKHVVDRDAVELQHARADLALVKQTLHPPRGDRSAVHFGATGSSAFANLNAVSNADSLDNDLLFGRAPRKKGSAPKTPVDPLLTDDYSARHSKSDSSNHSSSSYRSSGKSRF
jgi:hypothetical protein